MLQTAKLTYSLYQQEVDKLLQRCRFDHYFPQGRVLSIGCGQCYDYEPFHRRGYQYFGVDEVNDLLRPGQIFFAQKSFTASLLLLKEYNIDIVMINHSYHRLPDNYLENIWDSRSDIKLIIINNGEGESQIPALAKLRNVYRILEWYNDSQVLIFGEMAWPLITPKLFSDKFHPLPAKVRSQYHVNIPYLNFIDALPLQTLFKYLRENRKHFTLVKTLSFELIYQTDKDKKVPLTQEQLELLKNFFIHRENHRPHIQLLMLSLLHEKNFLPVYCSLLQQEYCHFDQIDLCYRYQSEEEIIALAAALKGLPPKPQFRFIFLEDARKPWLQTFNRLMLALKQAKTWNLEIIGVAWEYQSILTDETLDMEKLRRLNTDIIGFVESKNKDSIRDTYEHTFADHRIILKEPVLFRHVQKDLHHVVSPLNWRMNHLFSRKQIEKMITKLLTETIRTSLGLQDIARHLDCDFNSHVNFIRMVCGFSVDEILYYFSNFQVKS